MVFIHTHTHSSTRRTPADYRTVRVLVMDVKLLRVPRQGQLPQGRAGVLGSKMSGMG